jgi:hypothetical protein
VGRPDEFEIVPYRWAAQHRTIKHAYSISDLLDIDASFAEELHAAYLEQNADDFKFALGELLEAVAEKLEEKGLEAKLDL